MATMTLNAQTVTIISITCNGSQVAIVYADPSGIVKRTTINQDDDPLTIGSNYTP